MLPASRSEVFESGAHVIDNRRCILLVIRPLALPGDGYNDSCLSGALSQLVRLRNRPFRPVHRVGILKLHRNGPTAIREWDLLKNKAQVAVGFVDRKIPTL